jgi:DNA-binding transcriptional LysR family regulator
MNADMFSGIAPFVALADVGSFHGAATRLGVSTAAVSKAIAKLEQSLGVALVERSSRRMALTNDGLAYLEHCRVALGTMARARDEVATARNTANGELRVTVPFTLGRRMVAALPRLLDRHAGLAVRLQLTDRWLDPVNETDVAIRIGELPDSRLVARVLGRSRWRTLASPDYLRRRGTPTDLAALAGHECMRFVTPGGKARAWTFAIGGKPRFFPVEGRVQIDQGELLLDAAIAGVGICQVFDFMLDPLEHRGRLVEILADHASVGPPIHAVTTASKLRTANVRALLGALPYALA